LGRLDGVTTLLPDSSLFIYFYIRKEAVLSSQIEGTQSSISDLLLHENKLAPGVPLDDVQDVSDYVAAMNHGIERIRSDDFPLSLRLIKEIHRILLARGRGKDKSPGEFRRSQNWIGGTGIANARFIPPPPEYVVNCMSDLEKFFHNDEINVPHLIKIAISHYQFETVHPFLDGNGRIGRLLITLYLVYYNLLQKPTLYLSDFFMKNRDSYYDALSRVHESDDIIHWIKFFFNAVIYTGTKGQETFKEILSLKNRIDSKIVTLNRKAKKGRYIMQLLYKKPIVTVKDVANFLNITPKSANILIKDFENLNILKEITGHRRNRNFVFNEYLKLF